MVEAELMACDPKETGARYRNGSPDALFGSVLAIEAALKLVLAHMADGDARDRLELMRRRVEAELARRQDTTKYGTGAEDIEEGVADSLDALFGPRTGG